MKKKYSGAEKLAIVLQHSLLTAKPEFESVGELCRHYDISGEHLRQWRQQIHDRANEVFADRRFFREREVLEKQNKQLRAQVGELRRDLEDDEAL